ncbi:GNAT family N-acetyltransferase [Priestia megaterium]|nr:GNAT family N-acetyltransferase [Priestia megaterium]
MIVRKAVSEDIPSLANLIEELEYPCETEEMNERFKLIAEHSDYRTIVAETETGIAGLVGMQKSYAYECNGYYVRIVALIVSENHRNKRIGYQLMLEAEKWAKELGASHLMLNSGNRPERETAHRFYQNLGFVGKSTGFVKLIRTGE